MGKEANLRRRVYNYIRKHYPQALIMALSDRYHSGYPDLLILYNGKAIFMELKAPNGRLSKMQRYYLEEIQKRNIVAVVVKTIKEVAECMGSLQAK